MPETSGNYLDFSADAWAIVSGNYLLLDESSVLIQGDYLLFDIGEYVGTPTLKVSLKGKPEGSVIFLPPLTVEVQVKESSVALVSLKDSASFMLGIVGKPSAEITLKG